MPHLLFRRRQKYHHPLLLDNCLQTSVPLSSTCATLLTRWRSLLARSFGLVQKGGRVELIGQIPSHC